MDDQPRHQGRIIVQNAPQFTQDPYADVLAAFDLNGHALQVLLIRNVKVQPSINPAISGPLGGDKAVDFLNRPFLVVVFISGPKVVCAFQGPWNAVNLEILTLD